jgi:hypothetical protein
MHNPKVIPMATMGMGAAWRAHCHCGWMGAMHYVSGGNAHKAAEEDARAHRDGPYWLTLLGGPLAEEPVWPTKA